MNDDLSPFELTVDAPVLRIYRWHGWALDVWPKAGVNILWHEDRPVMEFGTPAELVRKAQELERAA